MSGRESKHNAVVKIAAAIAAELMICFLLLGAAAALLQKGSIREGILNPLLAVTALTASIGGYLIVSHGSKKWRKGFAVIPGFVFALMILSCRWIKGSGDQDLALSLLLSACAVIPPVLLAATKRRGKRRR